MAAKVTAQEIFRERQQCALTSPGLDRIRVPPVRGAARWVGRDHVGSIDVHAMTASLRRSRCSNPRAMQQDQAMWPPHDQLKRFRPLGRGKNGGRPCKFKIQGEHRHQQTREPPSIMQRNATDCWARCWGGTTGTRANPFIPRPFSPHSGPRTWTGCDGRAVLVGKHGCKPLPDECARLVQCAIKPLSLFHTAPWTGVRTKEPREPRCIQCTAASAHWLREFGCKVIMV